MSMGIIARGRRRVGMDDLVALHILDGVNGEIVVA